MNVKRQQRIERLKEAKKQLVLVSGELPAKGEQFERVQLLLRELSTAIYVEEQEPSENGKEQ